MRILCRVAATFRQSDNPETTYTVSPRDLMIIRDAPAWITKTRLFELLKQDGSIDIIETKVQAKQVESDPGAGADTAGKKPSTRARKPKSGADADPTKDGQLGNDDPGESEDEKKGDGE